MRETHSEEESARANHPGGQPQASFHVKAEAKARDAKFIWDGLVVFFDRGMTHQPKITIQGLGKQTRSRDTVRSDIWFRPLSPVLDLLISPSCVSWDMNPNINSSDPTALEL